MQIGEIFGRLRVTRLLAADVVEVQCTCGTVKTVRRGNLAHTSSCGCYRREWAADRRGSVYSQLPVRVGARFGRLVVQDILRKRSAAGKATWQVVALCDCGDKREYRVDTLTDGHAVSCGCYRREQVAELNYQHGGTHEPLFQTWRTMRERCLAPEHPRYAKRGITLHAPWGKYPVFRRYILKNLGPRPEGSSLDRIDNDRGYEPGNIRWAVPKQQTRNREITRGTAVDGEKRALADWAEKSGIAQTTIYARLTRGWASGDAVWKPLGTFLKKPGRRVGDTTNAGRTARNFLTLHGETFPIAEWAKRTGIPLLTLYRRKHQGWTDEAALTTSTGRAVK